MTIAELIDILKLLPGECLVNSYCAHDVIVWQGENPDFLGKLKHQAYITKDGFCDATIFGYDPSDDEIWSKESIKGKIYDPDFRAKFCAFLKEHFA